MTDITEVSVDNNKVSPWWEKVRDKCCQSENITTALMAALVGRKVAMDMSAKVRFELVILKWNKEFSDYRDENLT